MTDINRMRKLAGLLTESVKVDEALEGEFLQALKNAARKNSEGGYVQHVNRDEHAKSGYSLSDWYDSDNTIASYENGKPIGNTTESAPPGKEKLVKDLKKEYPGEEDKAFATAWSIANKEKGKNKAVNEDEAEMQTQATAADNNADAESDAAEDDQSDEVVEAYDLNNGYEDRHYADEFGKYPNFAIPTGQDGPVTKKTGAAGARQGDNPEQKVMAVSEEIHKELVYKYRDFLKESSAK